MTLHETTLTVLHDKMEIWITIRDFGTPPAVSGPPDRWDPGNPPEWEAELWIVSGEEPEEMKGLDADIILGAFEDLIVQAVYDYLATL